MIEFTLYNNVLNNPIKMKSSMRLLSRIMSMRSPWRYRHDIRVGIYAYIMANAIGMPNKQIKYMQIAGLLHDIGMSAINDRILDKPTTLSLDEYKAVRTHPDISMKILDFMRLPDEMIKAVAQHHETYNGDGYPLGLRGEEISLYGRILYLAEVFDTMTNETPYKKASELDFAIIYLKQMKEKKFDPRLVDIMLDSEEITNFYRQKERILTEDVLLSFGLDIALII